jgi:hypothetical protein
MPHPVRRRPAMPRVLGALAALLALAAAGCDSPSEPQGVAGRYSVYSVNGHRPPAYVRMSPVGEVQMVDADLRLEENGDAVVTLATRSGSEAVKYTTYTGMYQAAGDLLTLENLTDGERVIAANGVVISQREVAVTLHIIGPSYVGFIVYHIPLILRR